MHIWNPWHGCHKISPGCQNCYIYRRDSTFGKDSTIVSKTNNFAWPLMKNRQGVYKLKTSETVYVCMTSDFFIEEADGWRREIWAIIKERSDLKFYIVTKRIDRFNVSLPPDWGDGYDNVTICSTCENQATADYRIPIFLNLPIKKKEIIHEPMLESISLEKYLSCGEIKTVICGGESGPKSRFCDYAWILNTRDQCLKFGVNFYFKQTGRLFKKDNHIYIIPRNLQSSQAHKANIDYYVEFLD